MDDGLTFALPVGDNLEEAAGLLARLRGYQAAAPIATAALDCARVRPLETRLSPRGGAFNPAAAGLLSKWKDP